VRLIAAPNLKRAPSGAYKLSIEVRDDDAVDVASLGSLPLRVLGPADSHGKRTSYAPKLISTTPGADAAVITAQFKLSAPGGSWDAADNGTFSIKLLGDRVKDTSSAGASARTLGSFVVKIPAARGGSTRGLLRSATPRAANHLFESDSGIHGGKSAIDFRAISLVGMLQD